MSEQNNFINAQHPFALFEEWLADAGEKELNDPNAMALATVDEHGLPNVRMVLLKEADSKGFTFYTNFESAKGQEILSSMKAALCFHWKSLRRQVRVRGIVEKVEDTEADAYFSSRPKGSQIGAWASRQSRELESKYALEKSVAQFTAKYGLSTVPRPEYWSGFRIKPLEIEFWHDRPFRLHDRVVFTRDSTEASDWNRKQLYP